MRRSTVMFLSIGCTVATAVTIIAFSDLGALVALPGAGGSRELAISANEAGSRAVTGNGDPASSDISYVRTTVTSREAFFAPPIRQPMAELDYLTCGTQCWVGKSSCIC